MKITGKHFVDLAEKVAPFDTAEARQAYLEGRFPRSEAVKDLDRRYRWDLFYAARGYTVLEDLEVYDDHIDTALRRIIPDITNRPASDEDDSCQVCDQRWTTKCGPNYRRCPVHEGT